jgi:toxin ParE1/3/4
MAGGRWRTRLGAEAERDLANILQWTAVNFGTRQARVYRDTLLRAMS